MPGIRDQRSLQPVQRRGEVATLLESARFFDGGDDFRQCLDARTSLFKRRVTGLQQLCQGEGLAGSAFVQGFDRRVRGLELGSEALGQLPFQGQGLLQGGAVAGDGLVKLTFSVMGVSRLGFRRNGGHGLGRPGLTATADQVLLHIQQFPQQFLGFAARPGRDGVGEGRGRVAGSGCILARGGGRGTCCRRGRGGTGGGGRVFVAINPARQQEQNDDRQHGQQCKGWQQPGGAMARCGGRSR